MCYNKGKEEKMDINELIAYLLTPVAQVGLIMAIAELIKRLGLNKRFIPLVDLALGILSGVVIYTVYMGRNPIEGVVLGIALGLSACGLFSGVKNVAELVKEDKKDGKD